MRFYWRARQWKFATIGKYVSVAIRRGNSLESEFLYGWCWGSRNLLVSTFQPRSGYDKKPKWDSALEKGPLLWSYNLHTAPPFHAVPTRSLLRWAKQIWANFKCQDLWGYVCTITKKPAGRLTEPLRYNSLKKVFLCASYRLKTKRNASRNNFCLTLRVAIL